MTYQFHTISKQVLGDLQTPVSIYLKVRDIYPESALLESSDFHGNTNSLSFIALCPLGSIGINRGTATLKYPDGQEETQPLQPDFQVQDAMNRFLSYFEIQGNEARYVGLFGYTSFDAVKYMEPIPVAESHHEENDAPDILYILYKYLIVFDHFKNELTLIELLSEGETPHLKDIETLINNRNFASYNFHTVGEEHSPISDETYKAMVRHGIQHCLRGDVFQIVLAVASNRLSKATISKSIGHYEASILLLICSILISVVSGSLVLRLKHIVRSVTDAPVLILLPGQLSAAVMWKPTANGQMPYWMTRRKTPSMSCWSIWHATIFHAIASMYRLISIRKYNITVT